MKTTTYRIMFAVMAIVMLLSMTACGGNEATPSETTVPTTTEATPVCQVNGHYWTSATCQTAKSCSVCGEVEGDALGHSWTEATCEVAKTCSVCGETEGEALGHSWADANYQAPKTCTVCSTTEGEPLTAAFEEHGLMINVTSGETPYNYVTNCYVKPDIKTVGKLYVSGCSILPPDETHEALDGYEWRTVSIRILFNDDNANAYGMNVKTCTENYYDIEGWDASSHEVSDGVRGYTVNFNGVEYTECLYIGSGVSFSDWEDHACWATFTISVRVPVGYDGVVIGFRDASIEWGDGQYIYDIADENTLFFRMDGAATE